MLEFKFQYLYSRFWFSEFSFQTPKSRILIGFQPSDFGLKEFSCKPASRLKHSSYNFTLGKHLDMVTGGSKNDDFDS